MSASGLAHSVDAGCSKSELARHIAEKLARHGDLSVDAQGRHAVSRRRADVGKTEIAKVVSDALGRKRVSRIATKAWTSPQRSMNGEKRRENDAIGSSEAAGDTDRAQC